MSTDDADAKYQQITLGGNPLMAAEDQAQAEGLAEALCNLNGEDPNDDDVFDARLADVKRDMAAARRGDLDPWWAAPSPDGAARAEAEAEARWPTPGPGATQGEYDHAIDSQGAFEEGAEWGRADERARIVREMREYISRDESTGFAQGWNRAIEVVSARIESEVSNR